MINNFVFPSIYLLSCLVCQVYRQPPLPDLLKDEKHIMLVIDVSAYYTFYEILLILNVRFLSILLRVLITVIPLYVC